MGRSAVKIELKDDQDPRKLMQRYVELKLAKAHRHQGSCRGIDRAREG